MLWLFCSVHTITKWFRISSRVFPWKTLTFILRLKMKKPLLKLLMFLLFLTTLFILFQCKSVELQSALIYIELNNDWDKAMPWLIKAIQRDSTNVEAHILLGQGYGIKENHGKMKKAFDRATDLLSKDTQNHQLYMDEIEYLKDEFWSYSFSRGVFNLENNRLADAGIDFSNCIIIDDSRADAYINLAIVEEQTDNIKSAISHYKNAYKLDNDNEQILFYIADLYNEAGLYEKTIELMDQVLSLKPGLVEANIQKAFAYDCLGKSKIAIENYKKALSVLPDDPDLFFNIGRLYYLQGNYRTAMDYFEKALVSEPNDDETIVLMGSCYFSLAVDINIELETKIQNDRADISNEEMTSLKNEAKSYFHKAIPFFERAIQMNIDDPDVLNMLNIAYENTGQNQTKNLSK